MKTCLKCRKGIDENGKYCMIITKRGDKILEFECFHAECWKEHIEEAIGKGVVERIEKDKK